MIRLAGWFWFRVSLKVSVKPLAKAEISEDLTGAELSSSYTWILAGGSSSSPCGTLHRVAHDMASLRVSDSRARKDGQNYYLILEGSNHYFYILLVKYSTLVHCQGQYQEAEVVGGRFGAWRHYSAYLKQHLLAKSPLRPSSLLAPGLGNSKPKARKLSLKSILHMQHHYLPREHHFVMRIRYLL